MNPIKIDLRTTHQLRNSFLDILVNETFLGAQKECSEEATKFLKQKEATNLFVRRYGYFKPYSIGYKQLKEGIFTQHPLICSNTTKSTYGLIQYDNEDLYNLLTKTHNDILFIVKFIRYTEINYECPSFTSTWLLPLLPKILGTHCSTFKIYPGASFQEIPFNDFDKMKLKKFQEILQINAVKSFLFK